MSTQPSTAPSTSSVLRVPVHIAIRSGTGTTTAACMRLSASTQRLLSHTLHPAATPFSLPVLGRARAGVLADLALQDAGEDVRMVSASTADASTPRAVHIVLRDGRTGARPEEDGAFHDVHVLECPLAQVACCTGTGFPKRGQDSASVRNRDAVSMAFIPGDAPHVRLAVADGIGLHADAHRVAQHAAREAAIDQPFDAMELRVREHIAQYGAHAGSCISALRLDLPTDGVFPISHARAGDTRLLIVNRATGAFRCSQKDTIGGELALLTMLEQRGTISQTSRERLSALREMIQRHGENAAHVVTRSLNLDKPAPQLRKGTERCTAEDVLVLGTDGLFDVFSPSTTAEAIREMTQAAEAGEREPVTAGAICQLFIDAVMEAQRTTEVKRDNVGIVVAVPHGASA